MKRQPGNGSGKRRRSASGRNPKTAADARFETYLDDHGIPHEYEPDWRGLFGIDVEANPDSSSSPMARAPSARSKQFETRRITDRLMRSGGTAPLSDVEVFGAVRSAMTGTAREQLLPSTDSACRS